MNDEPTFQDLIDKIPADKRHLPVRFEINVGMFPSGEEGAEDWMMDAYFENIEVVVPKDHMREYPEKAFISIEVNYQ